MEPHRAFWKSSSIVYLSANFGNYNNYSDNNRYETSNVYLKEHLELEKDNTEY